VPVIPRRARDCGTPVVQDEMIGRGGALGARFALTKFRPTTLPPTLVRRSALHDRLTQGAGQRLTVVVGSAGSGKSVLLADWAAARPPGATSWLSCHRADADPARFWSAFVEAPRVISPGFAADAAELLAMDGAMSADVTASIANDAAHLPAGSVIVVDDFHFAAAAVGKEMADLVENWPAETAQLVLSSRSDPPLRLHRMRMSGELCELRDPDLYFSLAESHDLLANFGVEVAAADLERLHRGSEGWAAALQMVALSLRGAADPARVARALDVPRHAIAGYFVAEVLDQQPSEVAQFMLETSVLGELTVGACAGVTGSQDAAALLSRISAANLFLVALNDEQTSYRYHRLVRQVLRAELRAREPGREQMLHQRAAEWYESIGDVWPAAHHFLEARHVDRALALMQDRIVTDFLGDPGMTGAVNLTLVDPSLLAEAPEGLLAVTADLLIRGDTARGGQYLDLLEQIQPPGSLPPGLAARLATMRCFHCALTGRLNEAVGQAARARAIQERTPPTDNWDAALPLIMLRVNAGLEDFPAVEREAATALAMPELPEPSKLVTVPGAQALAWFEAGRLAEAADAAGAAAAEAQRLGFSQHFFAVDYLRALSGLALERRDLDTAERLGEQALSIAEHRRPIFEFLALLDRAMIWAARGEGRQALATAEAARGVLAGTRSVLLKRADELEALLRLSLGDLRSPVELATRLPTPHRGLLLARIALAAGDHRAAQEHLRSAPLGDLTPRHTLVRQLLLLAAAIERGDPMTASALGEALHTARHGGFVNTVVTTAPQVTGYLIAQSSQMRPDPYTKRLIAAALEARATQPDTPRPRAMPVEALTPAESRILKLLPANSYLQMAGTLYISRNTVKTHLRSIYQKLGVASRSEAIERAVELRLL
jgi:LuxR family transcriptional regulator, maltose regulon positive regulatory protein